MDRFHPSQSGNPAPLSLASHALERPSGLATKLCQALPTPPLAALLGRIFAPRSFRHARMDSHAGKRLFKARKYIWPVVCNRCAVSLVAPGDAGFASAGFAAANPRAHSRLALLDNARFDFFRSHPHLAQLLNCSFASNSAG